MLNRNDVPPRTTTRVRRAQSWKMIVAGVAIMLVGLPSSVAFADSGDGFTTPPAFHDTTWGNGDASRNVCSYAVTPGTAHCNAQIRTDSWASNHQPSFHDGSSPTRSSAVLGNNGAYDPSFLESAYNLGTPSTITGGAGQIVAIVDAYDDPNLAADLATYRSDFGLPPCATGTVSHSNTGCVFEKVGETGSTTSLPPAAGSTGWDVETSLDVEMVSAICPKCQILVVEASSTYISDLGASVNEAVALGANVVSNSYGGGEYSGENTDSLNYYNHPGIPIVVATGDSGYGVEFPSASPDVVAVGGTSLTQTSNTGTRNGSETVWSGAGAGCSAFEAKPSWQLDTGCARRSVADVAAVANPSTGVWVFDSYNSSCSTSSTVGQSGSCFAIYGGTSVATPIVSAIFALAANGSTNANYPASDLYANQAALYKVTSGSDGSCGNYLCNAAYSLSPNGYNGPTGLGTPGGTNSLSAFVAAPTLPPQTTPLVLANSSETIAAGTTVPLSLATGETGSGNGAVTFAAVGANCVITPGASSTATLSVTAPTTCSVTATKASDGTVAAQTSPAVVFTFTGIAQPALAVTSTSPTTVAVGTIVPLATSGGAGSGSVTFSVTGASCSLSGSSLSATATTTCSVTATKAASGVYLSATSPPLAFTFTGTAQSPLAISNTSLTNPASASVNLVTTGGSGNGAVSFTVTGTGCSVSGSSLSVTIAPTTCSVTATKAASGGYNAVSSPTVQFSFTAIAQNTLTITSRTRTVRHGSTIALRTYGGSGNGAVSYAVTGASCSIVNPTTSPAVTASVAGACVVTATKAASGVYAPVSSNPVTFNFN